MSTPPGFTPLPPLSGDPYAADTTGMPVYESGVPAPASSAPAPAASSPVPSPPWQPVLDEHTRHEMLLAQVDPQAVEKLWDRFEADAISRLTYRSPEVEQLVEYVRLEREKWMAAEAKKGARKKGGAKQQAAERQALTEDEIGQMPF